jgi:hypothetical protein
MSRSGGTADTVPRSWEADPGNVFYRRQRQAYGLSSRERQNERTHGREED